MESSRRSPPFWYLQRVYKENRARILEVGHGGEIRETGHKLKQEQLGVDQKGKSFLPVRTVKLLIRLPGEVFKTA